MQTSVHDHEPAAIVAARRAVAHFAKLRLDQPIAAKGCRLAGIEADARAITTRQIGRAVVADLSSHGLNHAIAAAWAECAVRLAMAIRVLVVGSVVTLFTEHAIDFPIATIRR